MLEGESHHLAVELADWKARLRKQRQELYVSDACIVRLRSRNM